jgi:hypothetical protein
MPAALVSLLHSCQPDVVHHRTVKLKARCANLPACSTAWLKARWALLSSCCSVQLTARCVHLSGCCTVQLTVKCAHLSACCTVPLTARWAYLSACFTVFTAGYRCSIMGVLDHYNACTRPALGLYKVCKVLCIY